MQTLNFIKAYQQYARASGISDNFNYWTAIFLISSVVQRKLWLSSAHNVIFPNFFVLLVAPTGSIYPSLSVEVAKDILMRVPNIIWSHKYLSPKELQIELRHATQDFPIKNNCMWQHSSFAWFLPRFHLLRSRPTVAKSVFNFLCDIADCPSVWETTKFKSIENGVKVNEKNSVKIIAPYLTILAGIEQANLERFYYHCMNVWLPPDLASRCIIVYDTNVNDRKDPFLQVSNIKIMQINRLRNRLIEISNLFGEFKFTDEAKETYKKWLHSERIFEHRDVRVRAYYQRQDLHLLKLAMILSLNEGNDLVITQSHIEQAISALFLMEEDMRYLFYPYVRTERTLKRAKKMMEEYIKSQPYMIADYKKMERYFKYKIHSPVFIRILDTWKKQNQIHMWAYNNYTMVRWLDVETI